MYNETTGKWSGFDIELFDEVAKRGEFEYDVVLLEAPPEGENWNYVLFNEGREMDMMCTWWATTAARKRRMVDFTMQIIDTSLILVARTPQPVQSTFKEMFWTFLEPFSRDLWLVILFSLLFSAIVLHYIDASHVPSDSMVSFSQQHEQDQELQEKSRGLFAYLRDTICHISNNFYQGWVLGTIQDPFQPRTPWAKVYLMSWTGVMIVLLAAYTAQLTTFLIVELGRMSSVSSLDDLIRSGQPVCAVADVQLVKTFLKNEAPSLPVVSLENIDEAIPAIRAGKCAAAVLGRAEAEIMIANNKACDMHTTGSALKAQAGAYAADTDNCGGFVLRTVDAILQGIQEDGLLDEMWKGYVRRNTECLATSSTTVEDKEESRKSLSLKSVGGLFIIHAAFACLTIVGWALQQCLWARRLRQVRHSEERRKSYEVKMPHVLSKSQGVEVAELKGKGKLTVGITITPDSSSGYLVSCQAHAGLAETGCSEGHS